MMLTARSLISRVLSPLIRAVEGQPRRGPNHLPITGGWLPDGAPINWWQTGISPSSGERSAVVERCISLYAETAASLPGAHWRRNAEGGRTRVTNSALSRILRKPNDYETPSSFMLNLVHSLYREGNSYALVLRNDRYEVESLHLMNPRMSAPLVAEDGSIFYRLSGNHVIDKLLGDHQFIVPQRDVLHVKLHANHRYPNPLVGETPLLAATMDIAVGNAFAQQQLQFLANQARPSAVLSTDMTLDRAQVEAIRDRWNDQVKGIHQGGTPILTSGLKVVPWSTPAKDAQLAELSKLSAERICWAFGIPLQLLGLANTPATSTETLMHFWLSTGLGFCLNHVEQSFDQLFGLQGEPEDYTEFSTDALLRTAQKDRIEALVRGVQGGVYSPNEARAAEDLPAVPHGDEPRVQAQVVPLSAAGAIPSAPAAPAAAAAQPTAAKSYRAAVQNDFEALRARAKRPERTASLDLRSDESVQFHFPDEGHPRGPVIRKTKSNGLQRATLTK
jgi:HK97 family phage portal protein